MFGKASSKLSILTLALTMHLGVVSADDEMSGDNSQSQALQEMQGTESNDSNQTQASSAQPEKPVKKVEAPEEVIKPIEPFTGKIVKNKVRLRLKPSLDSQILKEFNRNDMVIVMGETEDFYAVQPPAKLKAYVFRTYILDNVVEGQHVNVRSEPNTEAPVIAQLNGGDRVQGSVSAKNNKWYEISVPDSARYYVAKEYVEKIGDASLLAKMERRRDEVSRLLNTSYLFAQSEMQKPYDQVNITTLVNNYQKIIKDYSDFPDQASQAKDLLAQAQDQYLKKKVAFLEAERQAAANALSKQNNQLSAESQAQQEKIKQLEKQLQKGGSQGPQIADTRNTPSQIGSGSALTEKMALWLPAEDTFYKAWAAENGGSSKEDFYQQERQDSMSLKGMLEPYDRPVKNKPGDYVLVNRGNNLPAAYLYSTIVNLQDYVGREVTINVSTRPNNNFAFPAYFVLSVE